MFGLFKQNTKNPYTFNGNFKSEQKAFLESADEAYTMTFKQMDMKFFAEFSSRTLYIKLYNSLTLERPWAGVSNKFKKTVWHLIEIDKNGNFLTLKETIFDKVNVSRQLKLSVADDYKELWGITRSSTGDYQVEHIAVQ